MKNLKKQGTSVNVQIDDTKFNSIKEAAAFLEVPAIVLGKTLNNNNEHVIKGFKVKRIGKLISHVHGYVYCKRTGKLYNNAAELANSLNMKSSYINIALKKGSYVDKFKNRWIRISKTDAEDVIKNQEINSNIPQPKINISTPSIIKATPVSTRTNIISTDTNELTTQCNEIENNVQDLLSTLIHKGKYTEAHKALDALANFKNIFNEVE